MDIAAAGESGRDENVQLKRLKKETSVMPELGPAGNRQINPLLISLVCENVFSYFHNSLEDLKNFRLVCKGWNQELKKVTRKMTVIDVRRLIYPCAILWDESSASDSNFESELTPVFDDDNEAPYENIKILGDCQTLRDPNLIQWFEAHGSTVKHIRFSSSLTCFHHSRFLEVIMKKFCSNLKYLHLDNVASFSTFICLSRFNPNEKFICKLKELAINAEDSPESSTKDCSNDLECTYLNFDGGKFYGNKTTVDLQMRDEILCALFVAPLEAQLDPVFFNDVRLVRLGRMSREEVEEMTPPDGVLIQTLQHSELERIVVRNLPKSHCFSLLAALIRSKSNQASTLKRLEYTNYFPLPNIYHLGVLQKLQLNLTRLSFAPLLATESPERIVSLLSSLANTLEHLEFDGGVVLPNMEEEFEEEFVTIQIPELPNLKTFFNGNIFCTRISSLDFVQNLPKLEKCSLVNAIYHSSIFPLNPGQVFNLLFQMSTFNNQTHQNLKELHLDGKISFARHVELLREWFPNLKKVDLVLDGTDVFVEFINTMKQTELNDVKLSFFSDDNEWCNAAIANSIKQMPKLQFLEMIHLSDHPLVIDAQTCVEGFARVPSLTSLKLQNFGMFVDEVESIRDSLSKICHVQFSKCVLQSKPTEIEFSVGKIVMPERQYL